MMKGVYGLFKLLNISYKEKMSILVDILIVLILGLCLFLGYKKGLVKCAFKLLSFLIAIIIAFLFYKPISSLIIEHTQLDETLETKLVSILDKKEQEPSKIEQENKTSSFPEVMVESINETIKESTKEAKTSLVQTAAHQFTLSIISFGVMLFLFLLTRLVLWVIQLFTKVLTDLPLIKQVNTLGGLLYGLLEGFFILYLLLAIFSFVPITSIQQTIQTSFFGSILYEHNLILMLLF